MLDTNIDLLLNKDEVSDSGWHDILSHGPRMIIFQLKYWSQATEFETGHPLQFIHILVYRMEYWHYGILVRKVFGMSWSSVAMKIENGPKTNTKILWFLKMDQRQIWRIFVNSKILQRSLKIAKSSNIFEDTKIFKGSSKFYEKYIFLDYFRQFCPK